MDKTMKSRNVEQNVLEIIEVYQIFIHFLFPWEEQIMQWYSVTANKKCSTGNVGIARGYFKDVAG